jgi:hypothetical protein
MPAISINLRRMAIFAGLLVLALMVMEFNARLEELNKLNNTRKVVRAQATEAMQTEIVLQTQVASAGSDQAVEAWARSDAHYLQPGDQPVVPLSQPGSTPIAEGTSTPAPTPRAPWQIWWNLFFGK